MTFEVRNVEIEEQLKGIGRRLKTSMLPGYGFALLIFSFQPSEFFYTSSAERTDMIIALKELIKKLEG